MDKKTTKKISIIAAAVLAVAGAAGAIYYFTHRNTDELKKVPLAEIISESKIPDKEYDNLDLSNAVLNIPDAEKFYKLTVSEKGKYDAEECTANAFELFDILYPYVREENPDITFVGVNGDPLPAGEAEISMMPSGEVDDAYIDCPTDDGNLYGVWFRPNGRFYCIDRNASVAVTNGEPELLIHLDRGEQAPDTKYLVDGEEYSPAQALEFAEKLISEKIVKYLACDKVSPTELAIIKTPDGENYAYMIQFEYVYENAPLFHLSLPLSQGNSFRMDEDNVLFVKMAAPDKIGSMYNMQGFSEITEDGEYKDNYIPLDTATDMLSEYLAPYYKNSIAEVTIKYSRKIPPTEYPEGKDDMSDYTDEEWTDMDNTNREIREKVPLRPYWCFIMDKKDPYSENFCLSGNAFFVDMQTGEIIIFDKTSQIYVSSEGSSLESEELI